MKKLFIALLLLPSLSYAQTGVFNKIKQKVKDRVEQHVDESIDKSLDRTEEELEKSANTKTAAKVEEKGREGSKKEVTANITRASTNFQVYSRYDFVPGDRIVFADDFAQDVVGEFPLKWFTNNKGEVVTIGGHEGKWLRLLPGGQFVSPQLKKLPENFTAEFDLILQYNKGEDGYPYPDLGIRLMELTSGDVSAKQFLNKQETVSDVFVGVSPSEEQTSMIELRSTLHGEDYLSNNPKTVKTLDSYFGSPIHVAIWVQKERFRLWLNNEKVYDIPNAIPAKAGFNRLNFSTESSLYTEQQVGMYVTNFKIAEGAQDMRSKLLIEGKFATNGILFDVASDKIKPESSGVLKEIAAVLKESASVKVKIVGHTDNDGDERSNLDLSKRRALAVKNALAAEFKIEGARMETDGQGESKPIANNATKEGKLQNRRVEFVRL